MGVFDHDLHVGDRVGFGDAGVGQARVNVVVGGQFPRQSHHRHGVRSVGCDGYVEHDVGKGQRFREIDPERRRGVQHHDAGVVLAQVELGCGADHPGGADPADLASPHLQAAGQNRSGQRDRHHRAGFEVPGSTDDLVQLLATRGNGAEAQPLGVGMWLHGLDPAHHHSGEGRFEHLLTLDLMAQRGEDVRDLGGVVGGEFDVLPKPAQ